MCDGIQAGVGCRCSRDRDEHGGRATPAVCSTCRAVLGVCDEIVPRAGRRRAEFGHLPSSCPRPDIRQLFAEGKVGRTLLRPSAGSSRRGRMRGAAASNIEMMMKIIERACRARRSCRAPLRGRAGAAARRVAHHAQMRVLAAWRAPWTGVRSWALRSILFRPAARRITRRRRDSACAPCDHRELRRDVVPRSRILQTACGHFRAGRPVRNAVRRLLQYDLRLSPARTSARRPWIAGRWRAAPAASVLPAIRSATAAKFSRSGASSERPATTSRRHSTIRK